MKRIITTICVIVFAFGIGYSQSPRLVLSEEFTGETCGPCAAYNPGYNTLMENYPGQVISLKYQNNIPSTGPNFYTYNTNDISSRTTYYANSYSPHAFVDGNFWEGNAGSVTATQFNARVAVTSPFTISATHSFSTAYDSIFAHVVIHATAASSITTLKARIAISERNVYGYISPNGESEYAHVMRKLLPTAAGTALPSSMAVGDSMVMDVAWKIVVSTNPSVDTPIWSLLEVIAWVQDDATKEIKQAGHSPALISIDPAMVSMSSVTAVTCLDSVTPRVVITNNEATPVTSLDIDYTLDGAAPSALAWSGTINQGGTVTVNIPSMLLSPGAHSVEVTITNVNGIPDLVPTNNLIAKPAGQPVGTVTTFTQDFTPTAFPPVDWINENPSNNPLFGWKRSTAGSGSAKMDFYTTPSTAAVKTNTLYPLTPLDLTTATGPFLTFSVSHQRYSATTADRLDVIVSTNCGVTWTTAYSKSGATLATVTGYKTSAFTPTAAQWRTDTVNLSAYMGQASVLVAFRGISAYGNNAYVDNINLSLAPVGIQEHQDATFGFEIYPNPVNTGNGYLQLSLKKNADVKIEITDILGKVVSQVSQVKLTKGEYDRPLNLQGLSNGLYLVKVTVGGEQVTKRIILQQ